MTFERIAMAPSSSGPLVARPFDGAYFTRLP